MELIIKEMSLPEAIEFNFDELKQELTDKVAQYTNLVYTDNQIKEAKADVANLRKFTKALSDERIKVKKQCLKPYEAFEAKVKELEQIVNEPISLIDSQVKEYETQCKQAKRNTICEYWNTKTDVHGVKLEQIFDEKWLNASASMKAVQDAIDAKIEQIQTDLATLQNLPEFGFEASQIYKSTLDINKAIQEGHRLSEIQKAKESHEAEKAKLQEVPQAIETPVIEEALSFADTLPDEDVDDFIPAFDADASLWRTYKVKMTSGQKAIVEGFFASSGIEFKEI